MAVTSHDLLLARLLDTGTADGQAVTELAGCKAGEQVAQQALLVCAEGLEQLGFGVVARAGYARLDLPAGRGYLRDARAALMRVEAALQLRPPVFPRAWLPGRAAPDRRTIARACRGAGVGVRMI